MVKSDNFDAYILLAPGYLIKNTTVEETAGYTGYSVSGKNVQYTFRHGVGARYFLDENFGLNLEVGIGGGSFLQGGITLKL